MKNAVLLVVLLAACSGCPPQPKPTPIDLAPPAADMSSSYGFQVCPATPNVTFENICDGWLTQSGLSCATCPGEQGCFDGMDVIYCVNSATCAGDSNCFHVDDGSSGAPGGAAMKRKLAHPIKRIPPHLKRKS